MASDKTLGSFEVQWAEVFEHAEAQPSAQLWISIDGALANAEAGKYRQGIVFYRLLAAASIFIALGLGTLLYYQNVSTPNGKALSEIEVNNADEITRIPPQKNLSKETITAIEGDKNESPESQIVDEKMVENPDHTAHIPIDHLHNVILANASDERKNTEPSVSELYNEPIVPIDDNIKPLVTLTALKFKNPDEKTLSINTDIHMYNVPLAVVKKDRFKGNQLWAGLGVSSGSFDPKIGNGSESPQADAASGLESDGLRASDNTLTAGSEKYEPGFSYAVAANAGWKFARRWILQGGLQYQIAKSGTQTDKLVQNRVTEESFAPTNLGSSFNATQNAADFEVIGSDVNLNNNFQFLSIPLKVGYLVLDQKVQLGINAGFSADFFLKNKVSEANQLIESFEQSPGNDSPYHKTFVSGLFGIELGYNFLDNYYLTLEPSYKRSLSSFTKESSVVSSSPSRLGLTVGFRYLFR